MKPVFALLCSAVLLMALPVYAAPKVELWKHWTQTNASSTRSIDHSQWQKFLERYVFIGADGIHRIPYGKVTQGDKALLGGYLIRMQQIPVTSLNRDEQFAYWVNLYNAATVNLVLDTYPVESIKEVKGGLFNTGPWDEEILEIEGKVISLNDIEHRILRPIWDDPRIHYVVNCASLGCPNLKKTALTGINNNAMLDQAAKEFINHPRAIRFENDSVIASRIYKWFKEDFGKNEAEIISHMRMYMDAEKAERFQGVRAVDEYQYDWSLNDS
jgi:hypothetical protein